MTGRNGERVEDCTRAIRHGVPAGRPIVRNNTKPLGLQRDRRARANKGVFTTGLGLHQEQEWAQHQDLNWGPLN